MDLLKTRNTTIPDSEKKDNGPITLLETTSSRLNKRINQILDRNNSQVGDLIRIDQDESKRNILVSGKKTNSPSGKNFDNQGLISKKIPSVFNSRSGSGLFGNFLRERLRGRDSSPKNQVAQNFSLCDFDASQNFDKCDQNRTFDGLKY